jgi:hypothetical protein
MLNYYKNYVWTIYDTLAHKDFQMRYIPDQSFNIPEQLSEEDKAARIVTNSSWHKDKALGHYFNPRTGSVLCISSLTDPKDLRDLLERCDGSTVVYFVRVSNVLRGNAALSLLTRLIIRPPQDRLSRLRDRWLISPVRIHIRNREKEIEQLLNKSSVVWGEL